MRLDHLLSKEDKVEEMCFTVELPKFKDFIGKWNKTEATGDFPVAMRLGDTPVPIPNTMVKT